MTYTKIDSNLYLIPLDQNMIGFRDCISAWLFKSDEITFLVDPGPKNSINQLLDTLKEINVQQIDYILLTHIHIDHAGGTGLILEHFPQAKVVCHPKAIEHMISPEKLWHGSLKVLGDIAEAYGEIIPIPTNEIVYLNQIKTSLGHINVIETPGHAVHHLSFQFQHYLFAGEVIGVTHSLNEGIYARPATPPRFKLKTSLDSIDKVIALNVSMICFGHYGFRTDTKAAFTNARNQLLLWIEIIRDQIQKGDQNFIDRTIEALKDEDTTFANLRYMSEDIQQREIYFVGNSIKGMSEYLQKEISHSRGSH
ncbi:MAG: MBL fold metallo-hydrolase [Desulfamplus sp.]|nr:MBL fold metallo-hydrolase [Desulfamplus sp.]